MLNGISVLFSGGPDSTLAALYALDQADAVHLMTYHHNWMGKGGKQRKVAHELKQIFGENRVFSQESNIDSLFHKFHLTNFKQMFPQYRTFYIPWTCGACRLAMHVSTMIYNRQNGIAKTFDGANMESAHLFPEQMMPYIDVIKNLYQSFDMSFENPVYHIARTDIETEKYGLTTTKNTKKEHIIFSTQHTCLVGLAVHAHAKFYYFPFRGKKRTEKLVAPFAEKIIEQSRPFINSLVIS